MLTREEAQQLILTLIKAHQDAGDFFIVEQRTIERPFGWLFFVAVAWVQRDGAGGDFGPADHCQQTRQAGY